MIGQWKKLLTEVQAKEVEYIQFKCKTHPQICSNHEMIIKKLSDVLEAIHFAMAPLSEAPEHAIETKRKIKEILKYE